MTDVRNALSRRFVLAGAAAVLGAASLTSPRSAAAQPSPASFGPLRQIRTDMLDIGYVELGPAEGPPVLLLHGWPYDIHSFVEVAPVLAAAGHRVLVPHLRGYGSTRFLSAGALRNGQQAALALDAIDFLDALKIETALVAGYDWGARTADILAALWPQRCKGLVSVSGYLIGSQEANRAPLPPNAELQWWYQYYFATERGEAGYAKYTKDFARLIWELLRRNGALTTRPSSARAVSLENPDHVAVSIHNYRWRLGLAAGEARYDEIEAKLAALPSIGVPTITMEGDANGAPHPDPAAYARRFTGRYQHRLVSGGIGHNLPQEAPQDFARAVLDVAKPDPEWRRAPRAAAISSQPDWTPAWLADGDQCPCATLPATSARSPRLRRLPRHRCSYRHTSCEGRLPRRPSPMSPAPRRLRRSRPRSACEGGGDDAPRGQR